MGNTFDEESAKKPLSSLYDYIDRSRKKEKKRLLRRFSKVSSAFIEEPWIYGGSPFEITLGKSSSPGKYYSHKTLVFTSMHLQIVDGRYNLVAVGTKVFDTWCWHSMGVSDEDRKLYVNSSSGQYRRKEVTSLKFDFAFSISEDYTSISIHKPSCFLAGLLGGEKEIIMMLRKCIELIEAI